MSYKQPDTGDMLQDYFVSLSNFLILLPNMLNAETDRAFQVWFEKLIMIDKRALLICLRNNKSTLSPERLKYAQSRYVEEI